MDALAEGNNENNLPLCINDPDANVRMSRWLYKLVTGKQNHDTELANEVWACCMNKKKR